MESELAETDNYYLILCEEYTIAFWYTFDSGWQNRVYRVPIKWTDSELERN